MGHRRDTFAWVLRHPRGNTVGGTKTKAREGAGQADPWSSRLTTNCDSPSAHHVGRHNSAWDLGQRQGRDKQRARGGGVGGSVKQGARDGRMDREGICVRWDQSLLRPGGFSTSLRDSIGGPCCCWILAAAGNQSLCRPEIARPVAGCGFV